MQWLRALLPCLFLLALAGNLRANPSNSTNNVQPLTGHVAKVLPLFLDLKGHVSPSPSLFDRDAYQIYLQDHTNEISGIRFDVDCNAQNANGQPLKLRLELKGVGDAGLPREKVFEETVTPKFLHHWTSLTLAGADYKYFGVLAAWRATLWNGNQLLDEQKSFLWSVP